MWRRLLDRLNHEYWPWQLIYLPVWPFYFYQAFRQGRAVFFSNVNPAIDMGGFFGESKSAIYELLPEGSFPRTIAIPPGSSEEAVKEAHRRSGISFPLFVKPDVGERGEEVSKVNDGTELIALLVDRDKHMLMQDTAPGVLEFGLMFAKDPRTARTELLSVCGKRFLSVTGDGKQTTEQLLGRTWRGEKQLQRLRSTHGIGLKAIPSPGEQVVVEPVGNHCRGTVFFDANGSITPALRAAVDELMARTRGIHYGRLDVRAESAEALQEGHFTVIELNGVASEPGHIYDPAYSIFTCWRELLRHVRRLGPISSQLQRMGHQPTTLHALVVRCEAHFGWKLGVLRRLSGAIL